MTVDEWWPLYDFYLCKKGNSNKPKKYSAFRKESVLRVAKGDFVVAGNYTKTLANEKNKIDNLVEEISEEIVLKIGQIMNDI